MAGPIVDWINTLVGFCARRDVEKLSAQEVRASVADIADVAILFGGSILAGADLFADAMRKGVAAHTLVVGGEGHTTGALRERFRLQMGWPDTAALSEAALFARYLGERHGLTVDLLEQESTNCGNNVTNALRVLAEAGLPHQRLILVQDATMQLRMDAGFRRAAPSARIINFASHQTRVASNGSQIEFVDEPAGMWTLERYVSLLLGEVPRLSDDATGYGPAGRGYIAHVEVPQAVRRAYQELLRTGRFSTRHADPRWAGDAAQ